MCVTHFSTSYSEKKIHLLYHAFLELSWRAFESCTNELYAHLEPVDRTTVN